MKNRMKVICLMLLCLFAATIGCIGSLDEMQILDAPVFVCPTPHPQPDPTLRPYVIRPPQLFYEDDAVFAGGFESSLQARFRLQNWTTLTATTSASGDPRSIAIWELEVKNVGDAPYTVFPAGQMYVSEVDTANGSIQGVWGPAQSAANEAGISFRYEAFTLQPDEQRVFQLAAYIPVGISTRWSYLLDPTQTESPNAIMWTNTTNPRCNDDIADPEDGGVLPTPLDL